MGYERIPRPRAFAARVAGLFGPRKRDSDLDEEVQAHLQLLVDRFVAQGMSREDASSAARRQFGNSMRLQEDRREVRTLVSVEDLGRDLRYALRSLGRSRAFAAVAIATLGLGIGASTAIFSVIDNVLLEPFPYKGAARMVFLRIHDSARGEEAGRQGYTPNEFLEFAEQNHVFDGVIAASDDLVLYKQREGVEPFDGAHVTPGTFEFFGMPALYGRVMQPADYLAGCAAGIRDALQDPDRAFPWQSRTAQQNVRAEWDGENPNRDHAAALLLVWGGRLDSRNSGSRSGDGIRGNAGALVPAGSTEAGCLEGASRGRCDRHRQPPG